MKKYLLPLVLIVGSLFSSFSPAYSRPANAPTLTAPANGARLESFSPTLTWSTPAGSGATQVQLQVVPANNDGPGVDLILSPDAGQFTLPPPPLWFGLLPDMTYTWRVRISDAATSVGTDDPSWSDWSSQSTFKTPALNASTIHLVTPAPGLQAASLTPTLVWSEDHANAWYYEVQVSRDSTFGPDAFLYWELRHGAVTNPPRSYTVPQQFPLEPGRQYFWRVRPRIQGDGAPVDWTPASTFISPGEPGTATAQVSAIIDGSTIEVIQNGQRRIVHYLGIETPRVSPPDCFAAQAAAANSQLVEGQIVQLERDTTDTDGSGRLLRYVFLNGGMVNTKLVRLGFGRAVSATPNTRYDGQFQQAQAEAQENNRGIWSACGG